MAMKTYFFSAEIYAKSGTGMLVKRHSGTVAVSNEAFGGDLGLAVKNKIASDINRTEWASNVSPNNIHLTALNAVY